VTTTWSLERRVTYTNGVLYLAYKSTAS
jgi:hypothetical protein